MKNGVQNDYPSTMPDDEYRFWGEKCPRNVDDPEMVEKVLKKWGKKLYWVKSLPEPKSAEPSSERKKEGKKGAKTGNPVHSRGVM